MMTDQNTYTDDSKVPHSDVTIIFYADITSFPEQQQFVSRFAAVGCGIQTDEDGVQVMLPLGSVLNDNLPPLQPPYIDRVVQALSDYCRCEVYVEYMTSTTWQDLKEYDGEFYVMTEAELTKLYNEQQEVEAFNRTWGIVQW